MRTWVRTLTLPRGIRAQWKSNGFTGELAGLACYGREVRYTVRYESADGKQVIPFFKRENGAWEAGAAPEPRPLFGLDSITDRCRLYIVEGEACATLLHQLGLSAVTWQGGSNAAHKANWRLLEGGGMGEIVLWPDADEPGIKAMHTVHGELLKLPNCPPVQVSTPPPDAPAGDDCCDVARAAGYVGNGFDPIERQPGDDTLSDAIADFVADHVGPPPAEWTASPEAAQANEGQPISTLSPPPKDWQPADISYWLANPAPERRWLFKDMIALGDLCGLAAQGGSGKTFMSLILAVSLACGRPLLPTFAPCGQHKVMLLLGEDGPEIIWARLRSIVEAFELSDDDKQALCEHMNVYPGVSGQLVVPEFGVAKRTPQYTWLRDKIAELDPAFIVLDPRSRFDGCDENSAPMTTAFIVALEELMGPDRALLLTHHTAKLYSGMTTSDAARGSTALRDGCRWFGSIAPLSESEAGKLDIDDTTRVIRFELSKANYAIPCGPLYFERCAGGVLHEINPKEVKQTKLTSALVDFVKERGPVNLSDFQNGKTGCEEYTEFKNRTEAAKKTIKAAVDMCVKDGRLVKRPDGKKQMLDIPHEAE